MEEFNRACNTLSEMAFQQNLHRKYDIHHAGYHLIREETNLPAQRVEVVKGRSVYPLATADSYPEAISLAALALPEFLRQHPECSTDQK
jgi:hypothetical protein